jgi:hypothetical protein
VSSDVLITLLYHLSPKDRGLSEGDTSFGARYWSFTPDHPSRLIRVIDRLRRVEPAAAAKEVRSK